MYPHIVERFVDLAPFSVQLAFRCASKAMRARVDKHFWRHIAVGTPSSYVVYEMAIEELTARAAPPPPRAALSTTYEMTLPAAPYPRLPGAASSGPVLGLTRLEVDDWSAQGQEFEAIDWDAEEARRAGVRQGWRGVWNDIRVVDHFGAGYPAYDFPEAVVRYVWPSYSIGAAKSLVFYLRLPLLNRSSLPITMPDSRAERVTFRALVDIPDLNEKEEGHFDWSSYSFDYPALEAINVKMETLVFVFEVIKDGPQRKIEEEKLGGAIAGLESAIAGTLTMWRKVAVVGLERIPLHALGFKSTTLRQTVLDHLTDAVTQSTRASLARRAEENAPFPAPSLEEALANFSICTFEEWAATADPAEVDKPDIHPDFLGNPYHTESSDAPQLPWVPACPKMDLQSDFFVEDYFDEEDMDIDTGPFLGYGLDEFDEDDWDVDEEDQDAYPGVVGVIGG
jgi:hypothetical protein